MATMIFAAVAVSADESVVSVGTILGGTTLSGSVDTSVRWQGQSAHPRWWLKLTHWITVHRARRTPQTQ